MAPRASVFFFASVVCLVKSEPSIKRTCEPIKVELCKGLGYNVTGMPNLVGHELQKDADFALQTFSPLIQYGCSTQLHFFLCSVFVPMCTEKVSSSIGPCRSLCETVRSRCYPVLQGFGFPWPHNLRCSRFPEQNNHEHMCMEGPGETQSPTIPLVSPPAGITRLSRIGVEDDIDGSGLGLGHTPTLCSKYARSSSYVVLNSTGNGRCAPLCDADVLFSRTDKTMAQVWFSIWSGLCFLVSTVAVLTFLMDALSTSKDRRLSFSYFHHPRICLILCYNLLSVGWGLTAVLGYSRVACHYESLGLSTGNGADKIRVLLAQEGSGKPLSLSPCTVVFFFIYFFGTAALVWWVLLSLAWLVSGVSPLNSAVERTKPRVKVPAPLMQILGWGIPSFQTIAAIASRSVDADELTGVCSIGNQSSQALLVFLVIPQLVYLILTVSFLSIGWFFTQRRTRTQSQPHTHPRLNHHPRPRAPLPATVSKTTKGSHRVEPAETTNTPESVEAMHIGLFCGICVLPALGVLLSYLYELWLREEWVLAVVSATPRIQPRPKLWVFLGRIFLSLVPGVVGGAWVSSPKSLDMWRLFWKKLEPRYKTPPVKYHQTIQYYHPQAQAHTHAQSRPKKQKLHKNGGSETIV